MFALFNKGIEPIYCYKKCENWRDEYGNHFVYEWSRPSVLGPGARTRPGCAYSARVSIYEYLLFKVRWKPAFIKLILKETIHKRILFLFIHYHTHSMSIIATRPSKFCWMKYTATCAIRQHHILRISCCISLRWNNCNLKCTFKRLFISYYIF